MTNYYFPSCKLRTYSPKNAFKLEQYLREKHGLLIADCCRLQHKYLTPADTAYYICNTCAAILREGNLETKVQSIWELLLEDCDFVYPNYQGEPMSIQDCWRVYDNYAQQLAVRKIIKLLNISVYELGDNFIKADFCGTSLWEQLPSQNAILAPDRFLIKGRNKFIVRSDRERQELMQKHCKQFRTAKVVSYCVSCTKGLALGGANVQHLLDLLFREA